PGTAEVVRLLVCLYRLPYGTYRTDRIRSASLFTLEARMSKIKWFRKDECGFCGRDLSYLAPRQVFRGTCSIHGKFAVCTHDIAVDHGQLGSWSDMTPMRTTALGTTPNIHTSARIATVSTPRRRSAETRKKRAGFARRWHATRRSIAPRDFPNQRSRRCPESGFARKRRPSESGSGRTYSESGR